jgi:hypothetical protein
LLVHGKILLTILCHVSSFVHLGIRSKISSVGWAVTRVAR